MTGWFRRAIAWIGSMGMPSHGFSEDAIRQWKSFNPGRCMYCSYTRWANTEHGQNLKLEPHNCIEGNSPPAPLPIARIR
jgi:hypothetical protein